jgi:thiamine-phosphate diphosphorylase
MKPFPIYLLTDPLLFREKLLEEAMREALASGARLIQYRAKELSPCKAYQEATTLRRLTREHGAMLIVNDSVDLALAVEADGVHLGQGDLPLKTARRILGKERIIGVSTHGVEEASAAEAGGADYIGLGPIFRTQTKESATAPIGLEGIKKVRRAVNLPIYAIGGIRRGDFRMVLESGADGAAVIAGLAGELGRNIAEWLSELDREGVGPHFKALWLDKYKGKR